MYEELRFQKYFKNNNKSALPRSVYLFSEKQLFPYSDVIKKQINDIQVFKENKYKVGNHQIGRIDLGIKYKSKYYCVEIKYYKEDMCHDFWDATKILAYTEYFNLCEKPIKKFKPAIMIPINKIYLETLFVANKLGIQLFGIIKNNKHFYVEYIDDNFKVNY